MVRNLMYAMFVFSLCSCSREGAKESTPSEKHEQKPLEGLVIVNEDGSESDFKYEKDHLYCYIPARSPAYEDILVLFENHNLGPLIKEYNFACIIRDEELSDQTVYENSPYASSGRSSQLAVENARYNMADELKKVFPGEIYKVKGAAYLAANNNVSVYNETSGRFIRLYDWVVENTDFDREKLKRLFFFEK